MSSKQILSASHTWWSSCGQTGVNDVGWRIDYQVATPAWAAKARLAEIYTSKRFSDHATLIIDYSAPAAGGGARKRE